VITRRLLQVRRARRSELKQACESSQRPEFDAVFDLLLAQQHLVADEDNAALYHLAQNSHDASGAGEL
jgi:hypothetical protein